MFYSPRDTDDNAQLILQTDIGTLPRGAHVLSDTPADYDRAENVSFANPLYGKEVGRREEEVRAEEAAPGSESEDDYVEIDDDYNITMNPDEYYDTVPINS